MQKIDLTKGKAALVDDADFEALSRYPWFLGKGGYAVRNSRGLIRRHIYMHREVLNTPTGLDTDHVNGNRLDNQRANLRVATRSQNMANSKVGKANRSGYKGVHFDTQRQKYRASIRIGGKLKHLGVFTSPEYAKAAYDDFAKNLHGDFARSA